MIEAGIGLFWLGELLACLDKEAGEEALFFGGGVGPFLGKLAEATNGVMTIADHEGGESPILCGSSS